MLSIWAIETHLACTIYITHHIHIYGEYAEYLRNLIYYSVME